MKKIALSLLSFVILSGCYQSSAMLGPAVTGASTGNIYQAGLSYSGNKIIDKTTGKLPSEHVSEFLEKYNLENTKSKLLKKN